MKLGFCDFWGGFNAHSNFFSHLLQMEVVNYLDADIVIFANFGSDHLSINRNKTKTIFYTGENLRPRYNEADLCLTFDYTDDPRHIRVPLYYMYIDWFGVGSYAYGNPKYLLPVDNLYDNEYIRTPKTKFCAAIYSNPVPMRGEIVGKLSTYKKVDCYGRPFGNHTDGEDIKYNILKEYKFSICPENSRYNGYYTEKLVHAKTAGTIPIYWADEGIGRDFNTKSFIDISQFKNYDDMFEYVKFVDSDDNEYRKIFNEPLFHTTPNMEELKNKILEAINGN